MSFRRMSLTLAALSIGALGAACSADRATGPNGTSPAGFESLAAAADCTPDVTAPVINSLSVSPAQLWPPNHKYVGVTVTAQATDDCDPTPDCAISSVSSNEPVNGLGDGNTDPDWVVTSASTLLLRAERSGTGRGRTYTIGVRCLDDAGNASAATTAVTVAHDQGRRS
jgi:hypothetical protein